MKKHNFSIIPIYFYHSRRNGNDKTKIVIGNKNDSNETYWFNKLTTWNSIVHTCLKYFENNPQVVTIISNSPFSTIFSILWKCIIASVGGLIVSNIFPKYSNVIFNITMIIINVHKIQNILKK